MERLSVSVSWGYQHYEPYMYLCLDKGCLFSESGAEVDTI